MTRNVIFIIAALLLVQFFCSPMQASDEVTKTKDIGFKPNWNVGSNPVEVFHESGSRTITIAFNDAAQCTVVVETDGVPRLADSVQIE